MNSISAWRPARSAKTSWLSLCALALLAAGCEQNKEAPMPAVTPAINQDEIRDFTAAELDTLRALKKRHGVTRDEYWDDRGGVIANDVVVVWYPPGKLTVSHGMYVFDHMMKGRAKIQSVFGRVPEGALTVVCAQTMEAYTEATGRQWWHYSRLDDRRITFQPLPILTTRGLVYIAVPREYYEWAIGNLTGWRIPDWVREGFASKLAEEQQILEDNLDEFKGEPVAMTIDGVEAALEADNDKKQARIAYYNAYRMVDRLIEEQGQDKLVAFITAVADGDRVGRACEDAYGMTYDELLALAQQWERGGDE